MGFRHYFRKGSLNHLPDFLSRIPYAQLCQEKEQECVIAVEEIEDQWHLRRMQHVQVKPWLFLDWHVEDNRLYIHKRDYLLDPVTGNEYNWRLDVPQE